MKINYWFTIEPYVYINIVNKQALLYNTLDGKYIKTCNLKIIQILKEILCEKNCGVVLLPQHIYCLLYTSYYYSNLTHVSGWAGWRRVWQEHCLNEIFNQLNYLSNLPSHAPFQYRWNRLFNLSLIHI